MTKGVVIKGRTSGDSERHFYQRVDSNEANTIRGFATRPRFSFLLGCSKINVAFLKVEAKFVAFDVWEQSEQTGGD